MSPICFYGTLSEVCHTQICHKYGTDSVTETLTLVVQQSKRKDKAVREDKKLCRFGIFILFLASWADSVKQLWSSICFCQLRKHRIKLKHPPPPISLIDKGFFMVTQLFSPISLSSFQIEYVVMLLFLLLHIVVSFTVIFLALISPKTYLSTPSDLYLVPQKSITFT